MRIINYPAWSQDFYRRGIVIRFIGFNSQTGFASTFFDVLFDDMLVDMDYSLHCVLGKEVSLA